MMEYIEISFAENDSHGDRSGFVNAIDFNLNGDNFMQLETTDMCGRKIWTNDRLIVMYDVRIKHNGFQTWTGNMAWNTYRVPDYYAIGFINMLRLTHDWQCIQAWSSHIMNKWDRGEDISGFDLDLDEDVQGTVVNPDQLEMF